MNNGSNFRLGIGVIVPSSYMTFPISFNYLIKNCIDVGIGVTPWLSTYDNIKQLGKKNNKLHPNFWIGYRYQNEKKLFRIGIVIYPQDINNGIIGPGISFGKRL